MRDPTFPNDDTPDLSTRMLIPAVRYLRMSTDKQEHSIDHQIDHTDKFAAQYGFGIIQDYAEPGISGVTAEDRPQFLKMLDDLTSGRVRCKAVLIYDMSRFGRFQLPTESMYHEHRLVMMNIRLIECTKDYRVEENDGDTLMRFLEARAAGRSSHDLSWRVYRAAKYFVGMGFKQGGYAGYGLRRFEIDGARNLVDEEPMVHTQRKRFATSRVILMPGPDEEVERVHWIYEQFCSNDKNLAQIAAILNAQGVLTDHGRIWTPATVKQILTNEKYIGNNVYNRTSCRITTIGDERGKHIKNPESEWVRYKKAYPAIIDDALFERAQGLVNARRRTLWKDDQMLALLSDLYKEKGLLSGMLIEEKEQMPTQAAYRKRFGSLVRAYRLVGYTPNRDYRYLEINQQLRRVHGEIWNIVKDTIAGYGATVEEDSDCDLLTIDDEYTVSIVIARCQRRPSGSYHWLIRFDTSLRPDYTIAVRMHPGNETIRDYYILPLVALRRDRMHLNEYNDISLDAYRFTSLDMLFAASRNLAVMEAA
jgi:DNA invertase Pin-like site-specific DNA recombinase